MAPSSTVGLNPKRLLKYAFHGVSWQHPIVRLALPAVDAVDWLARVPSSRLRSLPRYSIRIRSRGIHRQFGGRSTAQSSELFLRLARAELDLVPESKVLDVGCGCGLTALEFARYLAAGNYTGLDVDLPSVRACWANRRLSEAGFTFVHAEVDGDVYSGGGIPAANFRFPFSPDEFSHVILCSVFTHLLPDEVENYLREIGRVLCPGGHVLFSTFLTDYGLGHSVYSFPHDRGSYRIAQPDRPRKGVAYSLEYLDSAIASAGLQRDRSPIIGSWRDDPTVPVDHPLASVQDLVLAVRPVVAA